MQDHPFYQELLLKIQSWAQEQGFQQFGVSDLDTSNEKKHFDAWLSKGYHGSMEWMETNKEKRLNPQSLHPGALRVISFRMNYLPPNTEQIKILTSPEKAYVSRYALGRDYHKLIRKRLATIAEKIESYCAEQGVSNTLTQRPFVDSAPVLERPFAEKAGLGWVGKHTLLIHKNEGSWFFLGEILTNIALPINQNLENNQCGDCEACLKVCPTDAFPAPYVLDARRCISYLTIENKGAIPEEFREPMGNRVFGCDDCQAICPWNKYASHTQEQDFHPRHKLEAEDLANLFQWSEREFLERTAGSPIRRIGYEAWLRNLSIGLGNGPKSAEIQYLLQQKLNRVSSLVQEHIHWALNQQKTNKSRKRKVKANKRLSDN